VAEIPPSRNLRRVRFTAVCITAAMGITFSISFMIFLATTMWRNDEWLIEVAKSHPAACILLPLAGMAAYCVVTLLEFQSGGIEFEIASVKFRGAAGTIVLWIFTFLAIAAAVRLCW